MTIGSLEIKLRPIRFGFLVNPNDKGAIKKAIHLNSLLWGGMFNPLIPCYKKLPKNWEEIKGNYSTASKVINGYIDGFDPDYLVNISDITTELISFDLGRIITYDDIIAGFKEDMEPNFGTGIFGITRQFMYDEMRFIRRDGLKFLRPKLSKNHNLFLSSIFGELDSYEKDLYEDYLSDIEIIENDVDITNYWEYLSPKYYYSRRIGRTYLEQRPTNSVLFYLDATNTLDVIDYWNLRAAGWKVYPVAKQAEEENGLYTMCEKVIEMAHRPHRNNKNIYHHTNIIKSRSTTKKEMSDFNKKININKHDIQTKPKVSLQHWYPRIWDEWVRQYIQGTITTVYSKEKEIELQKDQTEFKFKSPSPGFDLHHVDTGNPRFALELDSRVYGSEDLLAEVIPLGGNEVARTIEKYSLNEWRVGMSGPVYLARHKDRTINYEIPKAETVMAAWFKEKGWDIEISASGKIAKQMIKQLGGLRGIDNLKEEKLIELLKDLSNNGFIDEHRFKGKIAKITNAGKDSLLRDKYIKMLLEKQIFQLGVELKCPICTQRSWYSLNEMDASVRCISCLSDYKVQSLGLPDKKWAYKSFGTFGLPKQSYGAFSVLLTLLFLVKDNRKRTTTLLSFTAKKGNKEIEADFCLVIENAFRGSAAQEFIFAECKTYNKFERKDINRMLELAKEFPGATLVFSTFRKELTPAEKRMLKPFVNKSRKDWKARKINNPVIILTGNELFSAHGIPHCWKDMEGKAGEIGKNDSYPQNSTAIADTTQQIHLDMQPNLEWREDQRKKRQKVS